MKGKKWLIPIGIVLAVLLFVFIGIGAIRNKGYGISKGRYLESKTGSPMLIVDNAPISMFNRTNRNLFDDLNIGDEILVIHTGIAESYPAQTGVYAVYKLNSGTPENIPQTVIDQLTALGWLEASE